MKHRHAQKVILEFNQVIELVSSRLEISASVAHLATAREVGL